MRSFTAFRLGAQLCLAAAVLCIFAPFRAAWPALLLLILLALPAGAGAGGCDSARQRLLWGLPPLLALALPGTGWAARGALLALAVYAAVFLGLGRFRLEPWQYRRSALALIPLALLLILVSGLGSVRSTPSRCFAAAVIVLTLLALRALQLGPAPSLRWQSGSAGLFFLPLAAGALGGAALWLSLPALRFLGQGLGALLGGLLSLWNAFWTRIMGSVTTIGDDFFEESPDPLATRWTEAESAPAATEPLGHAPRLEASIPWSGILIVLGALALLLLLLWLLRRDAPARLRERPEEPGPAELLPQEPRARRHRRSRRSPKSDRDRLRAVYREYLLFLRTSGVSPGSSATTAEISADAAAVLRESDERLRSLYRKARYSSEPLSPEDLRAAEESLARLQAAGLRS